MKTFSFLMPTFFFVPTQTCQIQSRIQATSGIFLMAPSPFWVILIKVAKTTE
jgi:hypothetical protein